MYTNYEFIGMYMYVRIYNCMQQSHTHIPPHITLINEIAWITYYISNADHTRYYSEYTHNISINRKLNPHFNYATTTVCTYMTKNCLTSHLLTIYVRIIKVHIYDTYVY